jgi:hypothetical protein
VTRDAAGQPAETVLPDVVVLVSPAADDDRYQAAVNTFGSPATVMSDTCRMAHRSAGSGLR